MADDPVPVTVLIDVMAAEHPTGVMTGKNWSIVAGQDGSVEVTIDGERVDTAALATLRALGDDTVPCAKELAYLRLWREHAPDLPVSVVCLFASKSPDGRYWQMRQFNRGDFARLVPLLAHDPSPTVRGGVAQYLPEEMPGFEEWTALFLNDANARVQEAMLFNRATPIEGLEAFIRDTTSISRRAVASEVLLRRQSDEVTARIEGRS